MKLTQKLEAAADLFCYDSIEADLTSLRVAGADKPLTTAQRDDLLEASRTGKTVRLDIDAVTFRQSKAPRPLSKADAKKANARFVKFRDRDLNKFARGFKGRPMILDHDREDIEKVGGMITRSELVETATHFEFSQTLHLVEPPVVQKALSGTLRTFSIGWDPATGGRRAVLDSISCTVCRCAMFTGNCPHLPGDEHKVARTGETVIVEAEFRNPRAAETSGVSFPAVEGTRIESVRAALSEARTYKPQRKAQRMNEETLRRLGLPADATPEQIDKAIAALSAIGTRTMQLETELKAATLSAAENKDELAKLELAAKAKELADKEARLTAARTDAIARGLWAPGDEREKLFDEFATLGVDHAERYAKTLNPITAVGQPLVARSMAAPSDFGKTPIGTTLSSIYMAGDLQVATAEKTFRKMGITPEVFEKYGPHTWELRDPDDAWLDDDAGSLDPYAMAVH